MPTKGRTPRIPLNDPCISTKARTLALGLALHDHLAGRIARCATQLTRIEPSHIRIVCAPQSLPGELAPALTSCNSVNGTLRNHLLDQQPVSLVGRRPRKKSRFRFPEDLRTVPVLLPGLDSDIRVAFDRVLELAGIRPIILAEVDDMAMLRLLARDSEGVTLVPPVVVRDELDTRVLIEHCRIPEVTESFYAIVKRRRFPNKLLETLLSAAADSARPSGH